ncbi:MAG: alpha/beta fold hydrolase [Kiritimatiellae bacterium]|jgi:esterase|nr:alpha/beta fold hydrolase [Kiritimatiellia bacterium]
MILYYEEYGSGTPLVILHGLLGSGANWRTIAKALSDSCRVITIDLPNHGHSPHIPDADLGTTCDCIIETMRSAGVRNAHILGHSMGGKIAMQLSSDCPEILDRLIVADMLPRAIPPAHLFILRACEQLDLSKATRRSELDEELSRSIPQFETRAFILKNIRRDKDNHFYWQVNLKNIIANYKIVSDAPQLLMPYEGKTLFLGGEKSPYRIASQKTLILSWFPNAQIEIIQNAGHLLHADQPEEFCALVRNFLA